MKKVVLIALRLCVCLIASAINPNDHTTLLNENEKSNLSKGNVADDEEDVFYILTGEADKAIAEKDYPTAVLRLREAMAVEPSNPANVLLLSNLGMVYSCLDQDSLALKTYNEALALAPSMVTVIKNRALLHLKMGRDADAYSDFATVIEKDSVETTSRYYHGMMALYHGQPEIASDDFKVLEKQDPNGYNTWVAMSSLYSLTGRDRDAIPYFEKLIEADPSPEYYAALAGCLLAIGNLSEASNVIADGFRNCGEDPELYYYRAWLNKESYLLDAAKRDGRRAIELGADPTKVDRLFK